MVCPKCGNRENKKNICSKCGFKIDTPIKVKTFENEEVVIDAPIITESHTFIDEEHFQQALEERLKEEKKEMKKNSLNKFILGIITVLVAIVIIFGLLYVSKNRKPLDDKKEVASNINEFTSNEWITGEIKLDGVKFKLKDKYMKFVEASWNIDLEKYGYANGYILNSGDKTSTTIQLNNEKYKSAIVQIGFINSSKDALDIKECDIWSISINNKNADVEIPFELPGGIKNGSTIEEIVAAYGELTAENVYRVDSNGYTTYHYQSGSDKYLDLYVYDKGGLLEVNFKMY